MAPHPDQLYKYWECCICLEHNPIPGNGAKIGTHENPLWCENPEGTCGPHQRCGDGQDRNKESGEGCILTNIGPDGTLTETEFVSENHNRLGGQSSHSNGASGNDTSNNVASNNGISSNGTSTATREEARPKLKQKTFKQCDRNAQLFSKPLALRLGA